MATEIKIATLRKSDYEMYLQKGIGYSQYKQQMAGDLAVNPDIKIKEYINLNQRRMYRVEKTFKTGDDLAAQIKNLKHKIYWLVLTENWCGDASQILPVFNAIAEMSEGKIELKLVYRDQHPELMDAYLTNGTRSIPKLIQLDEHYNVTAYWGPRPSVAQQMVKQLKSNPSTAATYANELHLWYAKDKQKSLESEIAKLIYGPMYVAPIVYPDYKIITMEQKLPLPPFTMETALQKVQLAEDAWNSKDPERVSMAYTIDTEWRNRTDFINGREAVKEFLKSKWERELNYKLKKELWGFRENRMAVSLSTNTKI